MNDPAPPYGRGGWVCAALLLGLFAGGGITWAILDRRVVKSPLIVYQLPPPGTVATDVPRPAGNDSLPGIAAGALDAARRGAAPDFAGVSPRSDETGGDAPESHPSAPPGPAGATAEPGLPNQENTLYYTASPALRSDGDRLLHNHPKVQGCLANALVAMAPFVEKGFVLRDKVWEGEISLEEGKAVSCQLFKGNFYCFCIGTDAKGAKLSLQLYSSSGEPVDAEQSGRESAAGANATACWHCLQTGTFFVVVKLEAATQEKIPWGMVSAYR